MDPQNIKIPTDLLPVDGRFGCGPSKVRTAQIDAVVAGGATLMGTSHRKPPIRDLVGSIRAGLTDLFGLPEGWEIVLGNGGTTVFWDAATFGLVRDRSQHLVFGEFSSKFATACQAAPHLGEPTVLESATGTYPVPVAEAGIDLYALTHNETSTGVAMAPVRPVGADADAIVAVDATSAAGGLRWDVDAVDVYYFAPQKCFASDGGLWLAACSPAGVDRIEQIAATARWCPASIDLEVALTNSRSNQTYNTPAIATLIMLDNQVQWMNGLGGLDACASRCEQSASIMYDWAERSAYATPFVAESTERSAVVATIDLDEAVQSDDVNAALRANGVLDTDSYRKLGRNQLRIGMFPAIEPSEIEALTACIDHVVAQLA